MVSEKGRRRLFLRRGGGGERERKEDEGEDWLLRGREKEEGRPKGQRAREQQATDKRRLPASAKCEWTDE